MLNVPGRAHGCCWHMAGQVCSISRSAHHDLISPHLQGSGDPFEMFNNLFGGAASSGPGGSQKTFKMNMGGGGGGLEDIMGAFGAHLVDAKARRGMRKIVLLCCWWPSHGPGSVSCGLKGVMAALTGGDPWIRYSRLSSVSGPAGKGLQRSRCQDMADTHQQNNVPVTCGSGASLATGKRDV